MKERTELVTLFVTKEEKEKFLELDRNLKEQERLVFNHLSNIKRKLEQEIKVIEDMFSHFDEKVKLLSNRLEGVETKKAKKLEEIYEKIDFSRVAKFIEILERFSYLTQEDKELYKLLLECKL